MTTPIRTVDAAGRQTWVMDGRYHRIDGPAIIRADGSWEWRYHGVCHRLDGPAIMLADGSIVWCQQGTWHRLDGPAIVRANGVEEWWVDGHNITALSAHARLEAIRHSRAKYPAPIVA